MKGYPKWFSVKFISICLGVLFLTGLLLTPTTLEVRLDKTVPWRLSADSRVAVAGIHTLLALISIAIVGALSSIHMRKEWNRKRNRVSGISLVAVFVFLALSGLGIYYFGNETLSVLASVSHLTVGILILFIYIWHLLYKKTAA
ncbi:hypothetical protein [Bdellovibrio svalbardensis]|uniref:DUF4405 domain-containing protein n=1 Tax=Bdellovibrio svalbardensis TaxID=2972972 RepID=A0ABT6DQI6_9BACT|nr:hypothetical protein [Bdellovibrio svalbardensis]MDG0818179.1 hypothetical protein [Bdellovibrio svalbardensis]